MPMYVAALLGAVAALTCTILMFVLVMPDSKRESLPKFFKIMHDFFNFKFLVLEYILKALHMLGSLFCVGYGFFLLFSWEDTWLGGTHSYAGTGLLLMILGPVLLRVVYEFSMMFILLVRNTNQINRKMPKQNQQNQ